MPPVTRFVHANICVRALERSVPFYEMLGFEVFSDQIVGPGEAWSGLGIDGRRFRAVFMRIPGKSLRDSPVLDLIQFLDPPTTGVPYPTLHHVGIARLCFEVEDIETTTAELAAQGVEFVGPVSHFESGRGGEGDGVADIAARFVCFKDPDGTFLEVMQFDRAVAPRRDPGG